MKKKYSKPEIMFEDFSLSTNIAAGCETIISGWANGQCGLQWGPVVVFTSEVSGCTRKVVDGSEAYDGLCYHVPVSTNNLFNS